MGGMVVLAVKKDKTKAKVAMATPFSFPSPTKPELGHNKDKDYIEFSSGKRLKVAFFEVV